MIVPTVVEQVRSASRTMVRELGVMRTTLAGTGYSPSAVHTLLELGEHSALTATQLVQELGLEKSSVSRMVAKLIQSGELKESQGEEDGRTKQLSLTEQGKRTRRNSCLRTDAGLVSARSAHPTGTADHRPRTERVCPSVEDISPRDS